MQYGIGAVIGALLAVLLGIPSFTIDRQAYVEPPLFRIYCDLNQTDRWDFKCVPGAGTAVIILTGAALGAVGGSAFRRRRSDPSPTIKSATPRSREQSESQFYNPKAAYLEPQRRTAAVVPAADERRDARDNVILAAALELSDALQRRRLQTGVPAIPRKFATKYFTDELRDRATLVGVADLADAAVERAVAMGWLTSQGSGANQALARTSNPLPATSDSIEGEASDRGESTDAERVKPHTAENADASSDQAPAAKPTEPASLEELESLIRLHERGILTDAELEAAKARLVGRDDG